MLTAAVMLQQLMAKGFGTHFKGVDDGLCEGVFRAIPLQKWRVELNSIDK